MTTRGPDPRRVARLDPVARVVILFGVSVALFGGCGGDPADPAPAPAPETGAAAFPTFEDVTERAGLDVALVNGAPSMDDIVDALGSGIGWLDYDGDGDPDLYVAQGATLDDPVGPPDRLFRNDGDAGGDGVPRFTDVTDSAGLGDTRWSYGVAVADYDGDGDPDLYLTNWGANRLYRNDGGRFVDVANAAGVDDPGFGASAAWADVDTDGDLDLYLTNYVAFAPGMYPSRGERRVGSDLDCVWRGLEVFCGPRGLTPARDRLFRNDGDPDGDGIPTFRDVTAESGLDVPPAYGLGVVFFDADDDGDPDLYVANDSVANGFFVNDGTGRFEDGALLSGLAFNEEGHEQAGMGVDAGDYDGDGRFDLVVTNFSHDHDTLYRNEGDGFFLDESYPSGIGEASFFTLGWGVQWADFDLDGGLDLFVAHGHTYPQVDGRDLGTSFAQRDAMFRNRGDGTFEDVALGAEDALAAIRGSRSCAIADADGDGRPDLAVGAVNDGVSLMLSRGTARPALAIRLEGRARARDAIGARVVVRGGGTAQLREVRRNGSFLSSREPTLWFADPGEHGAVEITWPDGTRTDADLASRPPGAGVWRIRQPEID